MNFFPGCVYTPTECDLCVIDFTTNATKTCEAETTDLCFPVTCFGGECNVTVPVVWYTISFPFYKYFLLFILFFSDDSNECTIDTCNSTNGGN